MTAHSDGRKGEALTCRTDGKMDGRSDVVRFAVKSVPIYPGAGEGTAKIFCSAKPEDREAVKTSE